MQHPAGNMRRSGEQPQSLDAWLTLATKRLCEPAARRVRAEIEDFYEAAVEDAAGNGATGNEARADALALLGDAKAAGRRFRREHLTEVEARRMHPILVDDTLRPLGRQLLLLASAPYLICAALVAAAVIYAGRTEVLFLVSLTLFFPAAFALLGPLGRMVRWIREHWSIRQRIGGGFAMKAMFLVAYLAVGPWFYWEDRLGLEHNLFVLVIDFLTVHLVVIGFLGYFLAIDFSLLRKLGHDRIGMVLQEARESLPGRIGR